MFVIRSWFFSSWKKEDYWVTLNKNCSALFNGEKFKGGKCILLICEVNEWGLKIALNSVCGKEGKMLKLCLQAVRHKTY